MDLPLRADAPDLPDWGGLDIAVVGVPMDLGVTNRAGSRLGPRAVRSVERIGPYHHVHRMVPMAELKAADVGDVSFRSRYSLESSHADIEAYFARLHAAGVTPVAVGGDHSMSLPILKAIGRDRPVGMVHIDAHADTSGPYEGSRFHHGGPFREAVLAGVLDPARVIQVGIRGNAEYLWEFSYDSGMTIIHAEAFMRLGVEEDGARIRAVVGEGPTYLSFDVDSLDPAFAPARGRRGGRPADGEAMELVRGCAGLDIVGGDVVEVAPMYDATSNTAQAAATDAVRDLHGGGDGAAEAALAPPPRPCRSHRELEARDLAHDVLEDGVDLAGFRDFLVHRRVRGAVLKQRPVPSMTRTVKTFTSGMGLPAASEREDFALMSSHMERVRASIAPIRRLPGPGCCRRLSAGSCTCRHPPCRRRRRRRADRCRPARARQSRSVRRSSRSCSRMASCCRWWRATGSSHRSAEGRSRDGRSPSKTSRGAARPAAPRQKGGHCRCSQGRDP